jgi:hypothetical protein
MEKEAKDPEDKLILAFMSGFRTLTNLFSTPATSLRYAVKYFLLKPMVVVTVFVLLFPLSPCSYRHRDGTDPVVYHPVGDPTLRLLLPRAHRSRWLRSTGQWCRLAGVQPHPVREEHPLHLGKLLQPRASGRVLRRYRDGRSARAGLVRGNEEHHGGRDSGAWQGRSAARRPEEAHGRRASMGGSGAGRTSHVLQRPRRTTAPCPATLQSCWASSAATASRL